MSRKMQPQKSRQNQVNQHPFFNMDRAPSRVWMIRQLERRMDELTDKMVAIRAQAAIAQELCAEKGWAREFVRMLDCHNARLKLVDGMLERCERELLELYSGATEGWPLRGEVFGSV